MKDAVPSPSRRALLQSAAAGLLSLGGLGGCRKPEFSCTGLVGVAPNDVKTREALGYVDRSPDPQKPCSTCQQFEAAAGDGCGTCKLMRGPIHPSGTCKAYSAKS